ncbi:MAG: hypothetical protein IJP44_11750 [Bacteroidales bacterium]|nr:hypothetical protein [Bacteroidales bacterium]
MERLKNFDLNKTTIISTKFENSCIFTDEIEFIVMETNVISQDVSIVDALLAIYHQQSERVRRSFLTRVRQDDGLLDMPGLRTREEMMEVSQKRMKDIVAGREETLSHEEAMKLVDKAIAEAL